MLTQRLQVTARCCSGMGLRRVSTSTQGVQLHHGACGPQVNVSCLCWHWLGTHRTRRKWRRHHMGRLAGGGGTMRMQRLQATARCCCCTGPQRVIAGSQGVA